MGDSKKQKVTYTRADVIKLVARSQHVRSSLITRILDELEWQVSELLATADKDKNISVRLFEGISIDSTFLDEKEKRNNLTGEVIHTKRKIKPKVNVTRTYREKLTELANSCK